MALEAARSPEQRLPFGTHAYTPHEAAVAMVTLARQSNEAVYGQVMNLNYCWETGIVISALEEAARGGSNVQIAYDFQSRVMPDGPAVYWRPFLSPTDQVRLDHQLQQDQYMLNQMSQAGVRLHRTNVPHSSIGLLRNIALPIAGRDHRKSWYFKNRGKPGVLALTKMSLFEQAFEVTDCALFTDKPSLVNTGLHYLQSAFDPKENMGTKMSSMRTYDQDQVTVDSGTAGRSLSQEQTLELLRESDRVLLSGFYPWESKPAFLPDIAYAGKLVEALVAVAKRGGSVELFLGDPNNPLFNTGINGTMYRELLKYNRKFGSQFKINHFPNRMVHESLLVAIRKDGLPIAELSTSNRVAAGIVLGTEETTLRSTDPQIVQGVLEMFGLLKRPELYEARETKARRELEYLHF